jgi:glycosyltransferase involved in cell wall biosynthesis
MIKIAFIKFGGMANGGTEKYLQTIASHLPKDEFEVDFFYCDAAPYIGSDFKHLDTDESRVEYTKSHGVNLIKFNVEFKDVTKPTHDWVNTNFFELFDENNYDVIQTGRSGHPEYPFIHINKTPIIDSIHLAGMGEDKANVYKTILISQEQKAKWVQAGGNPSRGEIIPVPVEIPEYDQSSYLKEFGWEGKFVFGMHQRNDMHIFSPMPLDAYEEIQSDDTAFLILGGSANHRKQAKDYQLKNVKFLDTTSDINLIHKFLNTLNVYAHGRSDGEQCSSSIIEGMSHSLPIISHTAASMGQKEQIGNAGRVVEDYEEYSNEMNRMMNDLNYYTECVKNSGERFSKIYNVPSIISRFISLYKEASNA